MSYNNYNNNLAIQDNDEYNREKQKSEEKKVRENVSLYLYRTK